MINPTKKTRALLYAGIFLFGVFALLPYYWVIRASVLTNIGVLSGSAPVVPLPGAEAFTLAPFETAFDQYSLITYFSNSIFISLGATVMALFVSIPGAYAFARLSFPGEKVLFYTAVFTVMFPWIVIVIPVYEVFFNLGWIDTYYGLIVAIGIFVMPLCIWLLQGFFTQGVPSNIEEAALIDGLTEITAFIRVVLPLSLPAVAVTALFAFLSGWNNFLWVYLLANSENMRTATVAVYYLLGTDSLRQWNLLMAIVTLLILPPILFYAVSQRYVGEGLGGMA
jgi:multiple sugar transport system permease protein